MPDYLERFSSIAETAMSRIRVSNALNSALWLCGLLVIPCLLALKHFTGWIQVAVLILMFLPVILFSVAFLYFMIRDPSKLRSEDYEIRRQALELIQEKGARHPQFSSAVEAIANPEYRRLGGGEKEASQS